MRWSHSYRNTEPETLCNADSAMSSVFCNMKCVAMVKWGGGMWRCVAGQAEVVTVIAYSVVSEPLEPHEILLSFPRVHLSLILTVPEIF